MRPKNLEKEASIRAKALVIISEEGLENLSMQKLAKAAGVSPRTIYIKYKDKEDFLVRLFVDEVVGSYEKAVLGGFLKRWLLGMVSAAYGPMPGIILWNTGKPLP